MNTASENFKIRLGLFVSAGIAIFIAAIFIIGKQKNLFNPVFSLSAYFKNVSGLQVGNNIRFSGINVGTVDNIEIVNDTLVKVDMLIQKNAQKFIKSDCQAGIGSEGIIGDRILTITQGNPSKPVVKEGQVLKAIEPVETDEIIASLKTTAANGEIAMYELAEILYKINHGEGTLGMLLSDTGMASNIDKTIENLKKSSKGLNENMEAAKHNFLLKGYFRKKEKEKEKEEEKEEDKKEEKKEDKK